MRPLVLVLKAYLRSCGLNDVAVGGLSSYSLCNMVIVHLQEELKVRASSLSFEGEGIIRFTQPASQSASQPARCSP